MDTFMQFIRWPCHASLWHSVVAWMRNISVPENYILTLLSVIIFTGRPFPHLAFTDARGAHKRHQGHITESKIHISYSDNHDSTLMLSSIFLHVTLFRSALLLMLQNYKKKNCLCVSSTGSLSFPMSVDTHIHIPCHPYGDGDLNGIESHY